MISAREFCREPGYPITVFLTYSFSPLFFERVCLPDLEVGGSRRIVIAADAAQVSEAMGDCIGQLVHLGRRYVLAETIIANTFHPKLIVRLSPTGGRVWIGSGNLTYTGWGGNRELATSWSIGPGQEDGGAWLDDTLNAVSPLIGSATYTAQLEIIRNATPWLKARLATPKRQNVLLGLPDRPLAPQLAERWRDRRFTDLMLCTGSTDTEGAFLSWAHRTFGIERATICLSPAHASFDPARLSKLPLKINIVKADPKQVMHAKFYWFSGPQGNAAILGSANCSAAAWLAGRGTGNVELVVPYDEPGEHEFKPLLAIFQGPRLTPAQALNAVVPVEVSEENEAGPHYELVSLRLRSTGRILEAAIKPTVIADDDVALVLRAGPATTTVKLTLHGNRLTGRLPAEFDIGSVTPFAYAEVLSGGQRYVTKSRWLDNEAILERTSRDVAIDPDLRNLARPGFFNTDHQKMLEAVYAVSTQLLGDDDDAPDAPAQGEKGSAGAAKGKAADEDLTRAVDPRAIVRSLKELRAERAAKGKSQSLIHGYTLDGVIGQLFSRDDEPDIDLSQEIWTSEIETDPEPSNDKADSAKTAASQAADVEVIFKFNEQIEHFLQELNRMQFAQKCDAKRMVQALAFPLLLCVRGTEAGWLPKRASASVATRVVDIMLRRVYGRDMPKGLLRFVQSRYATLLTEDDFLRTVGDGTLWAALIATLATIEEGSLRHIIRYADSITAVFGCKELLAITDAAQLSALVSGLIVPEAGYALTSKAPRIVEATTLLTSELSARWDESYKEQGRGRDSQPAGSVLWSPAWGWNILPASPAQTYCSGYINVERAAAMNPGIKNAIDILLQTIAVQAHDSGDSSDKTSVEYSPSAVVAAG